MAGPQPQRNNVTKSKVCLLTVLFLYFFLNLYTSLLPAYFVLATVEMVISKISTEKYGKRMKYKRINVCIHGRRVELGILGWHAPIHMARFHVILGG